MPRGVVAGFSAPVSIGDTIDRDDFAAKLIQGGYRRVPLVEEGGDFSIRGNVIDIYPPTAPGPYRLLLLGDEIESIREIDVTSQRSRKELTEFTLTPARELILSEESRRRALRNLRIRAGELGLTARAKDRLAEMIGNGLAGSMNPQFSPFSTWTKREPEGSRPSPTISPGRGFSSSRTPLPSIAADERARDDISRLFSRAKDEEKFYLDEGFLFLSEKEAEQGTDSRRRIVLQDMEIGVEEEDPAIRFHVETDLGLKPEEPALIHREESLLAPMVEKIRGWSREGFLVHYLCAGEEEMHRMIHLLEDYSLPMARSEESFFQELAKPRGASGRLILREGKIAAGFALPGLRLVVVSEEEIFGKKARRRRPARPREGYFLQSFGELNEGDFVVHTDHGIGIYQGLQRLSVGADRKRFSAHGVPGGRPALHPRPSTRPDPALHRA